MWALKLSIPFLKNSLLSERAKKYNVAVIGYPVSHDIMRDYVAVILSGILVGGE